MIRGVSLASGEVYHIYNRGAHKQPIFTNESDYNRFLLLLYLSNNTESVHLSKILRNYQGRSLTEFFKEEFVDKSLVDILAYSLMPNHFHLVLQQKAEGGISSFMKKVTTAYSMYFNIKYEHSGVVFQGRFKSSHIDNEAYFRYIFAYLHLNPLELIEPRWKEEGLKDIEKVRAYMGKYPYSSHYDYCAGDRPQKAILSYDSAPDFLKTENDIEELFSFYNQGSGKDRP